MVEIVQAFDRERIAELPTDDASALHTKLATARARFQDRAAWLQPHERMAVLHKLASLVEKQREAFAHPLCVPGSDATTLAPDGPLADTWFHGAYTWASWFYRFMVRDEKLLSPAQAVHKLTGQPAARIGLGGRGVIAPGNFADVTVFDPARYEERGTTFEPNQLATGVVHVLVNGVHTLRDGEPTGERGGRVLRR